MVSVKVAANIHNTVNIKTSTANKLAEQLAQRLVAKKLIMATAESCTGGWIAQFLTALAGSSVWFDTGFVTYSNEAKINILNINVTLLNNFGAVSKEIVCEMATNLLKYNNNIGSYCHA